MKNRFSQMLRTTPQTELSHCWVPFRISSEINTENITQTSYYVFSMATAVAGKDEGFCFVSFINKYQVKFLQ